MISDAMRTHLLMLSEWWGCEEEDQTGAQLMTHAPVTKRQQVHVILTWAEGEQLPAVQLFPSAAAARAAWRARHGREPVD